jgi:HSP20 family molecular chaperone IbpA
LIIPVDNMLFTASINIFAGRALDTIPSHPNSLLATRWRGAPGRPIMRPGRWAPDMVSDALVSMLLNGGCGYEDLRLYPALAFDRRFDRLFNLLDESTRWTAEESSYPPYNIERAGEDHYWISLALAGFKPEEVTITAEQNVLTVEGHKGEKDHSRLDRSVVCSTSPTMLR